MPGSPESLPRPLPPRRAGDVVADWFRWVGPARIVASTCSVAIVIAGAAWLLRAPDPSVESELPLAGSPSSTSALTLPPPTTAAGGESTPATTDARVVIVHVAGAVAVPGVRTMAAGDRVSDAVAAAGGAGPDADLDGLNLAAPLSDGQRVYVPRVGEVDPTSVPSGASPAPGPGGTAAPAGPVDVNRAGAAELEALPGVGPATAAAIVDDRERNGPFASVDDLDRVSGIGPAKLAALRDLVTV